MKINTLDKDQVLKSLATSEQGLSQPEARRRLEENGLNEIEKRRRTSLFSELIKQFTHFLAILLWIAAGLCFISEYLEPGQGMLSLGIAIVAVIVVNALFSFIQGYRAQKAMEAMRKLLPFKVKVKREGKMEEVNANEIVPGDLVYLSEGDKVPADIRVIEASDLKVNNAPLTGESESLPRVAQPTEGELLDSPNIVFAGTTVVNGEGQGLVFATGMRTEFGRIASLTESVSAGLTPLQKEIIRVTRIIAALSISIGALFFVIGYFIGRTFWENFLFAIGVIVALVPEGLLPTVTLSLAMGSQRIAKKKALMKSLNSVETLGSVTVICTDKTGTLTQNKMAVTKIHDLSKGAGVSLPSVALLCNNVRSIEGNLKGDPTDIALYLFGKKSADGLKAEKLKEFPFDPDRKRMSVVARINERKFLLTKGAPESIFSVCSGCPDSKDFKECRKNAEGSVNSFMDMGLRVLSFACRELAQDEEPEDADRAERDMTFLGLVGLEDPPRPEVKEAIRRCRESGVRIIMITGDSERTARAVGREIGFSAEIPVYESAQISGITDNELYKKISADEIILARMTPEHKLRIVNVLKDRGERVAVTGDGVNDAPALKRADIGIAMGITGTDVAKEAADMVLLDDNFATIINAIEEGKAVFENIRKFTTYVLTSNGPELVPYILYVLFFIPLPLTIMQILGIDLGTDMFPALALGTEPPTPAAIKKPPRSPKERLINTPLLLRAFLFMGAIEAAAGLFGYFTFMSIGGWHWGQSVPPNATFYLMATTACYCGIVFGQMGAVFACRTYKESVFKIGFFSNKAIFVGLGLEIIIMLVVVYTPFGHRIFSTRSLPPWIFLYLLPFAVLLFLAEELRKWIARKMVRAG